MSYDNFLSYKLVFPASVPMTHSLAWHLQADRKCTSNGNCDTHIASFLWLDSFRFAL